MVDDEVGCTLSKDRCLSCLRVLNVLLDESNAEDFLLLVFRAAGSTPICEVETAMKQRVEVLEWLGLGEFFGRGIGRSFDG